MTNDTTETNEMLYFGIRVYLNSMPERGVEAFWTIDHERRDREIDDIANEINKGAQFIYINGFIFRTNAIDAIAPIVARHTPEYVGYIHGVQDDWGGGA